MLKGIDCKMIKGTYATGCYSHQENNKKVYVVVFNGVKYYGESVQSIFKMLEN